MDPNAIPPAVDLAAVRREAADRRVPPPPTREEIEQADFIAATSQPDPFEWN